MIGRWLCRHGFHRLQVAPAPDFYRCRGCNQMWRRPTSTPTGGIGDRTGYWS